MSTTDVNDNKLDENEESDDISETYEQGSEYDTDIEVHEEAIGEFDGSGRTSYLKKCDELGRLYCILTSSLYAYFITVLSIYIRLRDSDVYRKDNFKDELQNHRPFVRNIQQRIISKQSIATHSQFI